MINWIAAPLAFYPPAKGGYSVKEHKDAQGGLYIEPRDPQVRRVRNCDVIELPSGEETIVAVYLPHRGAATRPTLLYSHGNAEDLTHKLPILEWLSTALKVNIMSYDYTGYGCSTGRSPSVPATRRDIAACYQHLQTHYARDPGDIVLYGQSVGSGPSTWLAAREPKLAGLVLHTPLQSGLRVLFPNIWCWPAWLDVYPNGALLPKVKAPVCVLHGTEDDVVPFSHGQRLQAAAPNATEPLFLEGFNHSNIEASPQYVPHLKKYLKGVFGSRYLG